jgi:hypothetical protein
MHKLHLHEEILLLSLKDREGTVEFGTDYHNALAGAILAELLLSERVRVVTEEKKVFAEVTDRTPIGDTVLDECLSKIDNAKRRETLETWVSQFASIGQLKHRVAARLCEQGILRTDEEKVLLIFSRRVYPEVDPGPEQELIRRLEAAIFTDAEEVDVRTVITISLAKSANLLHIPFDKEKLNQREDRIKALVNGELIGATTQEAIQAAIQAAEAAMMVTVMFPVMFGGTSS